jgi:chemotaxis protein CheD
MTAALAAPPGASNAAEWMKRQLVVPMGGLAVSADPNAVLATYALGSCIAVVAYDPVRHVGGMLHFMLPSSSAAPGRAAGEPGVFADTGVPLLFEKLYALGTSKRELVVKVTGGAHLGEASGMQIGQRNAITIRKMFWKVGILTGAEDVGGAYSRTVRLHLNDGKTVISSNGQERAL